MHAARLAWRKKRDGGELSADECALFLKAYLDGELGDNHAAAMLATIFVRGMSAEELRGWTGAMLDSGIRLRWEGLDGPIVDKHSTGGVGDKASLPLAPALAACGLYVPMISGRGLGHTGGTLDKLESIPGLRVGLEHDALDRTLRAHGAVFGAQTDELVPADKRLYALRDATDLVESIPLIASSIMSKKLAEGIEALVLDVKYGSGSFLPDPAAGAELGRTMLSIARGFGVRGIALQTSMVRPLGRTVGHALEIVETIECLRGGGPSDLRELVLALGGELLAATGATGDAGRADVAAGAQRIARALDDGSALARFRAIVEAQGGDPRAIDEPERLPTAPDVELLRAPAAGRFDVTDCRAIGLAVAELGGGRLRATDTIDPAVGLRLLRTPGESLDAGEAWAELHHRAGHGLAEALQTLDGALRFDAPPATDDTPLVLARYES